MNLLHILQFEGIDGLIWEYLTACELWQLSKVTRLYHPVLNTQYKINLGPYSTPILRNLKLELSHLGFNYGLFCQYLTTHQAVLTGSLLLYCVNRTQYSDIDIFITEDIDSQKFGQGLLNLLTVESVVSNRQYVEWASDHYKQCLKSNSVKHIYEIKISHITFQIIQCRTRCINLKNIINQEFDFNLIKNYFDGKRLHMEDMSQITTGVIFIDPQCYTHELFFWYRLWKYSHKGYRFKNYQNVVNKYGKDPPYLDIEDIPVTFLRKFLSDLSTQGIQFEISDAIFPSKKNFSYTYKNKSLTINFTLSSFQWIDLPSVDDTSPEFENIYTDFLDD